MVEFALLLPLLILILALSADFGRAFTAYIAISGAAGSGASYGMQSTAQSTNDAKIREIALADAPSIWGVAPTVSSTPTCTPPDPQGYKCVQVTVRYTFTPIIRVPPIPNVVNMSRTVRMRVIG
jgi:Flp pilus assembly protein TadG